MLCGGGGGGGKQEATVVGAVVLLSLVVFFGVITIDCQNNCTKSHRTWKVLGKLCQSVYNII